MMSPAPPAAKGKITRTGLLGYTCAQHTPAWSIRPTHAFRHVNLLVISNTWERNELAHFASSIAPKLDLRHSGWERDRRRVHSRRRGPLKARLRLCLYVPCRQGPATPRELPRRRVRTGASCPVHAPAGCASLLD